ncbi:hypothetical protein CANARDRAFT_21405 [[Candida] arabinofermentans NRRL YB-2248]|uniref:HTH APSES-type domain-containing protein n=1 Tax=[Candida] arabinofermentans NRRL YB-2248 TaxID=983967 RepID=A0A1E4T6S1_9ASCO|nr:hypothetical protein CANARDRAFT_21405 [[Candida] arabinofermentans NRRL YB-2248]
MNISALQSSSMMIQQQSQPQPPTQSQYPMINKQSSPRSDHQIHLESSNQINYPINQMSNDLISKIPKDQISIIPQFSEISKRKYSTSIDQRNYLTVYEYKIFESWVIWDYSSGLVHLTGLWKAIGNSKADIVKLIESSPELESELKRVRGGFLKIQGTWITFETAKKLASKFCYKIRYALVPIFGESFIHECLKPFEKGFGMLRLKVNDEELKKKRTRKRIKISSTLSTAELPNISNQNLLPPLSSNIITNYPQQQQQQQQQQHQQQQQSKYSQKIYSNTDGSSISGMLSLSTSAVPSSSSSAPSSATSNNYSYQQTPISIPISQPLIKNDGLLSVLKAAQDLDNLARFPLKSYSTTGSTSSSSSSSSSSASSASSSMSPSNNSSTSSSYSSLYSASSEQPTSPLNNLTSSNSISTNLSNNFPASTSKYSNNYFISQPSSHSLISYQYSSNGNGSNKDDLLSYTNPLNQKSIISTTNNLPSLSSILPSSLNYSNSILPSSNTTNGKPFGQVGQTATSGSGDGDREIKRKMSINDLLM